MKFRIERDRLADAVAWTARTLPVRPPAPVLAGLLLAASDGTLTLSSFDYEVSGRVDVAADVEEPGRALVSGRLLADIARALPDRPVHVVSEGHKVVLTCGTARFTLLTLPVEEYPALPDLPAASGWVAGDVFAQAVSQVAIAAGRDDTLPVLTGVRVEIEGATVTLAATDRYRLAVREFTWNPEQSGLTAVALVPARTLHDTARTLTGGDKITLALATSGPGEGIIGFEGGGRRTTSRLLEGEFPKYRALLPTETPTVALVDTAPFVEAVKRVSLVAERNTPVRLSFTAGEVVLEAGTGDEAQASEAMDARLVGADIGIAFNPTFLLDGLAAINAPVARLAFTAPGRPAVITGAPADAASGGSASVDAPADAGAGAGGADGAGGAEVGPGAAGYRYLLMPVRLTG